MDLRLQNANKPHNLPMVDAQIKHEMEVGMSKWSSKHCYLADVFTFVQSLIKMYIVHFFVQNGGQLC